jgi:2-polyprenyl-3-methyl-5-hydroxy-6-metoxy-1,4-benzoquinol methylase
MRDYPNARLAERDALMDMVTLAAGMTVVDIQAAGGFLSDGVYERLGGQVHCLCVEPTASLNRRLKPYYTLVEDPVDKIKSIPSDHADVVLGLAGLHHSASKSRTVSESWRMLKPGGEFAVCDVIEGSPVARWLNEYVNRHNPAGHYGNFLKNGEATDLLRQAGFSRTRETVLDVPWTFNGSHDAARFFKGLFGLQVDTDDVLAAMHEYLFLYWGENRLRVKWELIYAYGKKP